MKMSFGIADQETEASIEPEIKDPLATKVDWSPLKPGGTNFRTNKLVIENSYCAKIKPTFGAIIFSMAFILAGLVAAAMFISDSTPLPAHTIVLGAVLKTLFVTVFVWVGLYCLISFTRPIIFDKSQNLFWKGWKKPLAVYSDTKKQSCTRLDQIYAIQLIQEYIQGRKHSYFSYEINLVLKDGSRINIIDYGSKKAIHTDAQNLSQFLGVPLWNKS